MADNQKENYIPQQTFEKEDADDQTKEQNKRQRQADWTHSNIQKLQHTPTQQKKGADQLEYQLDQENESANSVDSEVYQNDQTLQGFLEGREQPQQPLSEQCKHNKHSDEESDSQVENQDKNYHFYKEYCRLYYANIILSNRLQQLLDEKQDLSYKLGRLEANKRKHEEVLNMAFEIDNEKRKRHRRNANEITRHYKCPLSDCPKSYGSEGSLNQHIKIKHPEYYQELLQAQNAEQGEFGDVRIGNEGSYSESDDDEFQNH